MTENRFSFSVSDDQRICQQVRTRQAFINHFGVINSAKAFPSNRRCSDCRHHEGLTRLLGPAVFNFLLLSS